MYKIILFLSFILFISCDSSVEEEINSFSKHTSLILKSFININGQDYYKNKFNHSVQINDTSNIIKLLKSSDHGFIMVNIVYSLVEGTETILQGTEKFRIDYASNSSGKLIFAPIQENKTYYINDISNLNLSLNKTQSNRFEFLANVETGNSAKNINKILFQNKRVLKFEIQDPQTSELSIHMENEKDFYKKVGSWWAKEFRKFNEREIEDALMQGNYQFAFYQNATEKINLGKKAFECLEYMIINSNNHLDRFTFGSFSTTEESSIDSTKDFIIKFSPDSTTVFPKTLIIKTDS